MVVSPGKLRIVTPSGTRSNPNPMTGLFCRNNLGQGAELYFFPQQSLTPSCVTLDTYLPSLCFCLFLYKNNVTAPTPEVATEIKCHNVTDGLA